MNEAAETLLKLRYFMLKIVKVYLFDAKFCFLNRFDLLSSVEHLGVMFG